MVDVTNGSAASQVLDLVHPSLFPLVYGLSRCTTDAKPPPPRTRPVTPPSDSFPPLSVQGSQSASSSAPDEGVDADMGSAEDEASQAEDVSPAGTGAGVGVVFPDEDVRPSTTPSWPSPLHSPSQAGIVL